MNPYARAWCSDTEQATHELRASAREFVAAGNSGLDAKDALLSTVADTSGSCGLNPEAKTWPLVATKQNHELQASAREFVPAVALARTTPLCRFFLRGACRKGLDCPFVHDASQVYQNDEVPIAKEEASCPFSYLLDEGIQCEFGPGMLVSNLRLGSMENHESVTVSITGLPSMTEYDVEARLSPFGSLLRLKLEPSGNSSFFAVATFSEPSSATAAAAALHGSNLGSWTGVAGNRKRQNVNRKCPERAVSVIVKENTGASVQRNTGVSVKVQWYAPSRCAWVHFSRSDQAKRAVKECNGKSLHGRELVAKFQPPTYRQTTSFTMWIGNLGESVTTEKLQHFVQRRAKCRVISLTLGKLPFTDKTGPALIQKLLSRDGGPLTSFELAPDYLRHPLKRKALARFANSEDAERACEFYRRHERTEELGGSRLFLQRLFSTKYTLPVDLFESIWNEIDVAVKQFPDLRYNLYENVSTRTISLQADDQDVISSVKRKLDPIVAGDIIRDPSRGNRALWNRYVVSNNFRDEMKNIAPTGGGFIFCDKRRQEVRVYGSDEQRNALKKIALKCCADAIVETHAVPISQVEFEYVLLSGRTSIDKITLMASARKISINIKNQSLLVEGSALQAKRAKACITKLASGREEAEHEGRSDSLCPVCFCSPDGDGESCDSMVCLSCKHCYCRECFDAWLGGGNIREYPLVCLDDGCPVPVALVDLQKNLEPEAFLGLLRLSLDNHVRRNPSKLQFCISPACPGIYEIMDDSNLAYCSSCSMEICTECKVSHRGQSCKEHRLASQPPDRLRMRIVDEILTLRCPRCKQAFLDYDGCFALACGVCPCRFCGWCLKDCGHDAHPHVAKCPFKAPGAGMYFGTFEQFEAAQQKRRREGVLAFLNNLTPSERKSTLQSIRQDLDDLGIRL